MDDLKNEIFARPEDEEEAIVEDTAHIVTADGASPEMRARSYGATARSSLNRCNRAQLWQRLLCL